MSSGLLRYRSAPSALFGDVCEDFLPVRPSSPDTETMFARFLTAPERNAHYAPPPPTTAEIFPAQPHNRVDFSGPGQQMMYHSHHHHQIPNHSHNPVDIHYRAPARTEQIKIEDIGGGNDNLHNLIRQNSSPAGLFSHLEVENGLKHQLSFSSQTPSFQTSLWDDTPPLSNCFTGLKRPRESELEAKLLAGLNMQSKLQIQDSVLCKMRAKRGCATHPRSIAERVRRTRISERMRKLQELVPSMDKQTNTSDMLDLAVEHIKDLQEQVKKLSEIRASCTCCSKRIRYSNTGV